MTPPSLTIVAYKGFGPDLKCRDFQFEIGQTFEHAGRVAVCARGFHACENPWDVWSYYGPVSDSGSPNRFARVSLSGQIARHGEDSKIAAGKITLDAELTLPEFISDAVKWIIAATKVAVSEKVEGAENYSGDSAQIGSSGDSARIGSSGHSAQIGSSGDFARIGSSGDFARIGSSGRSAQIGSSGRSAQIGSSGDSARIGSSGDFARIGSSGRSAQIGSSGDSAQIGSSGDSARIGSSGDSAQIGSSGDFARIGSSGHSAQIGSSGDFARIGSSGVGSTVACAGMGASVKAGDDGAICLAYHDGKRNRFAIGYVGEGGIKAGVFYTVNDGKLVEA